MFLRRTGVFTEQQLRLKFLQVRGTCLEHQLTVGLTNARVSKDSAAVDPISTGGLHSANRAQLEAYWAATRRVELTRVQLFDIVTQYR